MASKGNIARATVAQRTKVYFGKESTSAERRIPFAELGSAPFVVDAVYEGSGAASGFKAEPLRKLIPGCTNQGGFRMLGGRSFGKCTLLVLSSSGTEVDWPDALDAERGVFTYFGDNRKPGHELHDTPQGGNRLLRDMFTAVTVVPERLKVPPVLVFTKTGQGASTRFRGLGVPSSDLDCGLVAIWRQTNGQRFQNYRAQFDILDCPEVPREWIADVREHGPAAAQDAAPDAWKRWIKRGEVHRLSAPRTVQFRSKEQQLPSDRDAAGQAVLRALHGAFSERGRWAPHDFEFVAAELFRMIEPRVQDVEITRPTADGGRDAVGTLRLGGVEGQADGIRTEFALEAKAYGPGNGVGVKELSRLISRLRHRQFGVLVTTSYLAQQAYKELRADGHPVIVMSGADIVEVLRGAGIRTEAQVIAWAERVLA
jgi:hypothetical protein